MMLQKNRRGSQKSKEPPDDIQQLLNKDFAIMDDGTENNVDV